MRKIALYFAFLLLGFQSFSQDTTWVQTFTFDSITTRRAWFPFPAELDTMRFEKVMMYYKLKCSPLTTWDQYDCGEWDYLTYTRVFDHTGNFDSIAKNSSRFLSNWDQPATIDFVPSPNNESDYYFRDESTRNTAGLIFSNPEAANTNSNWPFKSNEKGNRYQILMTQQQLLAANVQAGPLNALKLYVQNLGVNGALPFPNIRMKASADVELSSFHTNGFIEVYNASRGIANGLNALVLGENNFDFYQPFIWDGTSNIVIEFYAENDFPFATSLSFDAVSVAGNKAISYAGKNGQLTLNGTNYTMLEYSDEVVGPEVTIEFWAKGNGVAGTNTSFLEAYDTLGNRVLNIHMPWSNNNLYWDAGNQTGYDRINKAMAANEIDSVWNHWAFVKKQSTGEMFIYKNGSLWHSGTNLNREVGYIHRFILGASKDQSIKWKGNVDEFRVFNSALTQATIQANYQHKIDASHPNWSNLKVYYDFDNEKYAVDHSPNGLKLMPSEMGMIQFDEVPVAGVHQETTLPKMSFGQGPLNSPVLTYHTNQAKQMDPIVVFEQVPLFRHFDIVQSYVGIPHGMSTQYDQTGNILSQQPVQTTVSLGNQPIVCYNPPYEVIHDVEIARYITPYGIQFDLGPNGFTWKYDVTDYQMYLKGLVDLAAHNTQELVDLKFAFIKGIPPRDVHARQAIWSDFKSYNFAQMANDVVLQETPVVLADTSQMFKIKTRMSGHGQVGDAACCEWVANDHQIKVDGVPRFNWNIWQTTDCGDNPNIGQGGTWPYAREGWCPGDRVKEHEFELTPFVSAGDTVKLDYVINAVPGNDPGQAGGNYIAAYDLISYSAPNFQNDAAIADVLNPNNWEYYSKWNPTCQNPRVVLKNTGAQPLTSCRIFAWITYGDNIVYDWTGNLGFLEETVIELPVDNIDWWTDLYGHQIFTAWVADVNGIIGEDEYNQNSLKTVKFDAPERIDGAFYVWLTTNNKADENKYRLMDHAGNILFQRDVLDNQTQYKDTFNLAPGCYSIVIEDSDSDGLGFWYSSQVEGETTGQMRLRKVGGSYIEFFPADFGNYHRYDFSVGFTLGIKEADLTHEIAVYPNPTNGLTTVEVNGSVHHDATVELYDLSGRKLLSEKMNADEYFAESFLDLSPMKPGTYLVRITTNQRVYTKELIKQ
ncbi:MAG: T9SS type A sorting domain-containing protein [Flavobacteriales bacterium]